jgi:dTDP-glucose pyrophosphorylase
MMKPTLLILAAGMGSRYGGLKQVDAVGPSGEAIIDYCVYDALRAGFSKLVFVIRRDIEKAFREAIGDRFERRAPVEYAFQELDMLPPGFAVPPARQKPWGTAHAVLASTGQIHEPFAVINADDFYGASAYGALAGALLASQKFPPIGRRSREIVVKPDDSGFREPNNGGNEAKTAKEFPSGELP